jgi:hypothetical protein
VNATRYALPVADAERHYTMQKLLNQYAVIAYSEGLVGRAQEIEALCRTVKALEIELEDKAGCCG